MKIIHYGTLENEVEKTTTQATTTPVTNDKFSNGAVVIDENGNILTYDAYGRLVKEELIDGTVRYYPTGKDETQEKGELEIDPKDASYELAKELITEFTGTTLFEVLEAFEDYGMWWEDMRPIFRMFVSMPASVTKNVALLQFAVGTFTTTTFQPEKVNYSVLLKYMTDAIFKTLMRRTANAY